MSTCPRTSTISCCCSAIYSTRGKRGFHFELMIAIVTPYPISSIEQSPPNPPANCKKFDSAAFVKFLRYSDAPSNLTCIIHPTVSAFDSISGLWRRKPTTRRCGVVMFFGRVTKICYLFEAAHQSEMSNSKAIQYIYICRGRNKFYVYAYIIIFNCKTHIIGGHKKPYPMILFFFSFFLL